MKKILIVEDVEFNVDLLVQLLEDEFALVVASDGASGVEMASREQPDLVLMDMSLPVLDGWEATRQIKADQALGHIPVIALTAHAMQGDKERALDCGCSDYLSKPIDEDVLFEKIRRLMPEEGDLMEAHGKRSDDGADAPTVLVVDDEPFNVDYLTQELDGRGYRTITARNGSEALECVAAYSPDLVLLDVMMPIIDGFTVCRRLKADERTRLIPVVIMTALDAVEDRVKGIEAGADDFLTKPVDDRELVARIRTALRHKHTVDRKLGELSAVKDHFAKFVPEAVKRLVAENPEAPALAKSERDVTVLFLDVSGYADMSERLAADALNAIVEKYFSVFLDCLHCGGGDINETAGDGFMAIFQADAPEAHAIRAVETGLALLDATRRLNAENRAQSIAIHLGINSGKALVGSTRFEGASGARWTFTASGPVTNIAARLAASAEPNQILVGADTARRLGERADVKSLGPRRLKNISRAVEAFSVDGA